MNSVSRQLASQMLVGEHLKNARRKAPNRVGFVYKNQRVTFKEMDKRVTKLSNWLISEGIEIEDKVGFLLRNSISFIEVFYGVAYSGATGVPINFRLGAKEIVYIVNAADVEMLFIEPGYVGIVESVRDEFKKVKKIIVVETDEHKDGFINYEQIFAEEIPEYEPRLISETNEALILFTSGTTGIPNGVVITHRNINTGALNMIWEWDVKMFTVTTGTGPFFHVGGINRVIINCLVFGKLIIYRDFNPVAILEDVEKEKVDLIPLVPTAWRYLFEVPKLESYDLSSVKTCTIGAAPVPFDLKKRIMEVFKEASLIVALGSTETSTGIANLKGDDILRKENSVGLPILTIQIRLVDEEMNDVPIGEVGELVYRGPTIMKEYYKNPEKTNEAFKGGWFHGGDLARMDDEGYIYIVDRKKDVIISGGENIYPAELEYLLEQHEAISECAVVGLPDEEWGESVKVFVVKKKNAHLEKDDVVNYCIENLASYKKPKYVQFIDSLPKNTSGKLLKGKLKELEKGESTT